MLGRSKCEVLSCVDIKDAYHSICIDEKSKEFCGILPYFGSQHYRYEVLPMGLDTSPAIWMTYVNFLLDSMTDRDKIIAIMDDLLLHSTRAMHMSLLVNLFETMIKNGLKLSPKKSQLFVKELVYLGTLFTVYPPTYQGRCNQEYPHSDHSKRLQKFLWCCELPCDILSRVAEIAPTYLRIDEKDREVCLDTGTSTMLHRDQEEAE